jgi:hypothetical protein
MVAQVTQFSDVPNHIAEGGFVGDDPCQAACVICHDENFSGFNKAHGTKRFEPPTARDKLREIPAESRLACPESVF